MHATRNNPVLPSPGDTVTYRGRVWVVLAFDFNTDDLTIQNGSEVVTINRLDID